MVERKDITGLRFIPCHRMPERSPWFFGRQFPLCYRCLFILLGYSAVPLMVLRHVHLSVWIGAILILPLFVDGLTQLKKWRVSNNALRALTGFMTGIGQSILIVEATHLVTRLLLATMRGL